MARQGNYGANHMVGIEEAFSNLAQATTEDRSVVVNSTGVNDSLTAQVAEYVKHLSVKYSDIAALTKQIANLQGKVKNLKGKL